MIYLDSCCKTCWMYLMGTQATSKASLLTPHVSTTMVPLWRLQWVPINGSLWMLQVFWSRVSSLTGWDVDWDQYQNVESTNTKKNNRHSLFFFWHSTLATENIEQNIYKTNSNRIQKTWQARPGLNLRLTKPSCNHQPLQVQSPPQPLQENAFTRTQIYWTIPEFLPKWSTANRFELLSIGNFPSFGTTSCTNCRHHRQCGHKIGTAKPWYHQTLYEMGPPRHPKP